MMRRMNRARAIAVFVFTTSLLATGFWGAPQAEAVSPSGEPDREQDVAACPVGREEAGAAARQLVAEFREHFARDVRVPDWCFASDDDYSEVADRLLDLCSQRPASARAEALALVALKAGRCAGFEAGRRSSLGRNRQGSHLGMEPAQR